MEPRTRLAAGGLTALLATGIAIGATTGPQDTPTETIATEPTPVATTGNEGHDWIQAALRGFDTSGVNDTTCLATADALGQFDPDTWTLDEDHTDAFASIQQAIETCIDGDTETAETLIDQARTATQ